MTAWAQSLAFARLGPVARLPRTLHHLSAHINVLRCPNNREAVGGETKMYFSFLRRPIRPNNGDHCFWPKSHSGGTENGARTHTFVYLICVSELLVLRARRGDCVASVLGDCKTRAGGQAAKHATNPRLTHAPNQRRARLP